MNESLGLSKLELSHKFSVAPPPKKKKMKNPNDNISLFFLKGKPV